MNLLFYLFSALFFISSIIICYQDFKIRLVSLWVLIILVISCFCSVVFFRDYTTLIYNLIGAIIYFSFIWLVLKFYLFLKYKKFKIIMNQFLGMADVIVMLSLGCTFNTIGLIFFFCFGFTVALISFFIYVLFKKGIHETNVPLAGLLVISYILYVIILNFIQPNYLIDCSFLI